MRRVTGLTGCADRPSRILMVLLSLAPFFFYLFTMAPGMGLGDTALLLDEILALRINTHVNNHNITVILGSLFQWLPFGNVEWKGNLMSVVVGGGAVLVFAAALWKETRNLMAVLLASAAFTVMQSQWWHSTIVECYAVNAVFTAAMLWMLSALRQGTASLWLPRLFALSGLALFNHVQLGFLAVGATMLLIVQARSARHPMEWLRLALRSTAWFLVGFLPYSATFLHDAFSLGFASAVKAATGGQFQGLMFQGHPIQAIIEFVYLLGLQFPSPFLLLIPIGAILIALRWPHGAAMGLLVMFVVNTGFFMFFNTWDRFAFLLPSFTILSFAGGIAADHLFRWMRERLEKVQAHGGAGVLGLRLMPMAYTVLWMCLFLSSALLPPWLYSHLASWGNQPGIAYLRWNNNYTMNSHRANEFIANPDKSRWNDVEIFADLLFARLPEGAILFDDDSRTFYPVQFIQQHRNRRKDLSIRMMNSWGFTGWGVASQSLGKALRDLLLQKKPVFLVSIDQPFAGALKNSPHIEDVVFERFYLDESHWVYRLSLDAQMARSYLPVPRRIFTGRRSSGGFVHFSPVGMEGVLGAQAEFDTNYRPVPVVFRWYGPDATLRYESAPFTVPAGNSAVWSMLQLTGPREPGPWTVRFYMEGQERLSTVFQVER